MLFVFFYICTSILFLVLVCLFVFFFIFEEVLIFKIFKLITVSSAYFITSIFKNKHVISISTDTTLLSSIFTRLGLFLFERYSILYLRNNDCFYFHILYFIVLLDGLILNSRFHIHTPPYKSKFSTRSTWEGSLNASKNCPVSTTSVTKALEYSEPILIVKWGDVSSVSKSTRPSLSGCCCSEL